MQNTIIKAAALAGLLALSLAGPLRAEQDRGIELGVLPMFSTRTVFEVYRPLREYLQERLGRPVTLVTAPDYRTHVERTRRGDYRFLVTAPHFARLAQTEHGYRPLVRVQRDLNAIFVVRDDSAIRDLAGLRGSVLTGPDSLAIVSMLAHQLLRRHGLDAGRDVCIRAFGSFSSAVLAVTRGEAAAAIATPTALAQIPGDTRRTLRTIAGTPAVPHLVFLARREVAASEAEQLTRLLVDFAADGARGQPFFQRTGFVGLVRVAPGDLAQLDPYVRELKRELARR